MSTSKCLLLAALFVLADGAGYNYDRSDPLNGPDAWGGECSGVQGTPINLCGAKPFPARSNRRDDDDDDDKDSKDKDKKKKPSYGYSLSKSYSSRVQLTIKNVGNTIQVYGPTPSVWAPELHKLVGRSPADTVSNPEWVFAQMHIHWGHEGNPNDGSEHALGGKRYAAEAHFVHFNKARGATIGAAVASGKNDALLVIGAFLDQGSPEDETPLVRLISDYVPRLETAPQKTMVMTERVDMTDIIDPSGAFYSYGGGLTTPGCNEIVTWIVQAKPAIISAESLEKLKSALEAPGIAVAVNGNFRPLQPLGNRQLYISQGYTPSCAKVQIMDVDKCGATISVASKTSLPTDAATPAETTSSATPSWVWIVVGVAFPATALVSVLGTLYYTNWRARHVSGDEMVVFTPLPEMQRGPMPSSVADVEVFPDTN